jgi:ABC-type branched-subunit amino acid transport system substrate-binding protein
MRRFAVRRRAGAGLLVMMALILGIAACGSNAKSAGSAGQAHGKITLGLIGPLSGPVAQTTTDARRGAQVAINQINAAGGVRGGQKLALKVANEPTDPAGSVTAMRNFASEGVPIVMGDMLTPDCDASAPVAQSLGILDISAGCAGGNLTGPHREFKTFYSAAGSDSAQAYALGHVLPARYPKVRNLYVVGYDYLPGTQTASYIENTWKAKDPALTVKKSYFVPLTQLNFSSIVSTIGAAATAAPGTQGLLLTTYGSGTLALLQEMQQSGLINKFAFIAATFMYYQPAVALKGKAPKVVDSYSYVYWGAFHNSVNKAFVAAYQKLAPGLYPSDWSFQAYVAVLAAAKALDKAKKVNLTDLNNALQGLTINGPTGTFTVGGANSHQFLFPTVVGELGGDPSSPDGVKAFSIATIPGPLSNSIAFKE